MNNGIVKTNKRLNSIELITIILMIISICNFSFIMYHGVMVEMIKTPSYGGIGYPTEEERIAHTESPEERAQKEKDKQQRLQYHEKIFNKSKPINTGIGIVCLISLVTLLIIEIIKNLKISIIIIAVLSILCNLLLVFGLI